MEGYTPSNTAFLDALRLCGELEASNLHLETLYSSENLEEVKQTISQNAETRRAVAVLIKNKSPNFNAKLTCVGTKHLPVAYILAQELRQAYPDDPLTSKILVEIQESLAVIATLMTGAKVDTINCIECLAQVNLTQKNEQNSI